jgi:hypothetical protein
VPIVAKHSSGLHTVGPGALRAAVTKQLADEPEFLSLTEMMAEDRAAALTEFPDYTLARVKGGDGDDECALLVKDAHYRIVSKKSVRLSELPIPRRSGRVHKNFDHALVVSLESLVTGSTHTRIVVHRPSGVEGLIGIRRNGQGACYRDGTEGLKRLLASIEGRIAVTGDWNLSLRRKWVRRYFDEHFPEFTTTWHADNLPERGTHFRRVIDFSLVRGYSVAAAEVVSHFGASDHRAIRETHGKAPT